MLGNMTRTRRDNDDETDGNEKKDIYQEYRIGRGGDKRYGGKYARLAVGPYQQTSPVEGI